MKKRKNNISNTCDTLQSWKSSSFNTTHTTDAAIGTAATAGAGAATAAAAAAAAAAADDDDNDDNDDDDNDDDDDDDDNATAAAAAAMEHFRKSVLSILLATFSRSATINWVCHHQCKHNPHPRTNPTLSNISKHNLSW